MLLIEIREYMADRLGMSVAYVVYTSNFGLLNRYYWFSQTCIHSAPIRNLIKLKGTAKLTVQDEQVCLKDSKYILFEILENQTW